MKVAIIAITRNGIKVANKIQAGIGGDVYIPQRFYKRGKFGPENANSQRDQENANQQQGLNAYTGKVYTIKAPFIEFVHRIFPKYNALIFVTATGIAVRSIAGVVWDKRSDPAVVVVDEQARYAISLLSGHLGGANELASEVAKILDCMPIITTASDAQGFEGIDVLAKKLGLYIDNFIDLKRVSACLVNGEKVAISMGMDFPREKLAHLPGITEVVSNVIPEDAKGCVFVTDEKVSPPPVPYVILRPQNTVLGIGARKGASYDELLALVNRSFVDLNLSEKSVSCISSIDIKKDEECICRLAQYLNVPIKLYTKEQLSKFEHRFPISPFVKKTVGVGSVAKPSACIASCDGKELGYYTAKGITLAVFKRRTS